VAIVAIVAIVAVVAVVARISWWRGVGVVEISWLREILGGEKFPGGEVDVGEISWLREILCGEKFPGDEVGEKSWRRDFLDA
jgi:hypothetical protein